MCPERLLLQGIENLAITSSVSLQHVPYDKDLEKSLPKEVVPRLSFAKQKVEEIVAVAKAAKADKSKKLQLPAVGELPPAAFLQCRLAQHHQQLDTPRRSAHSARMLLCHTECKAHTPHLQHQLPWPCHCCQFQAAACMLNLSCFECDPTGDPTTNVDKAKFTRAEPFEQRRSKQYNNEPFATTTIGSFPQTPGMPPKQLQTA